MNRAAIQHIWLRTTVAAILIAMLALVVRDTEAQESGGFVDGPPAAGLVLAVHSGGPVDGLSVVAPNATSFWVTVHGEFHGYHPGSPAFVNQVFIDHFPDGIPAGTPLLVLTRLVLAGPPPPSEDPPGCEIRFEDSLGDPWIRQRSERFCVHYPAGTDVAEVKLLVAEVGEQLSAVESVLGARYPVRMGLYLFPSGAALKEATGSKSLKANRWGLRMVFRGDAKVSGAMIRGLVDVVSLYHHGGSATFLEKGLAHWVWNEVQGRDNTLASVAVLLTGECPPLNELVVDGPGPSCVGLAELSVRFLVEEQGGMGRFWEVWQGARGGVSSAPVDAYGLSWSEIESLVWEAYVPAQLPVTVEATMPYREGECVDGASLTVVELAPDLGVTFGPSRLVMSSLEYTVPEIWFEDGAVVTISVQWHRKKVLLGAATIGIEEAGSGQLDLWAVGIPEEGGANRLNIRMKTESRSHVLQLQPGRQAATCSTR